MRYNRNWHLSQTFTTDIINLGKVDKGETLYNHDQLTCKYHDGITENIRFIILYRLLSFL